MKKTLCLIMCVITIFTIIPNALASPQEVDTTIEEFELWAMSPCISGGMSREELAFQKALYKDFLSIFPLPKLGERYVLAGTYAPIYNSGTRGKTTLYDFTYYLLFLTDDGYEIIDRMWLYSDYYDGTINFADVSDYITDAQPGDKPLYISAPGGIYTGDSSWGWYSEYVVVTDKKKLVLKAESKQTRTMSVYNGCLWWTYPKSTAGTTMIRQRFDGSSCSNAGSISLTAEEATAANGFINFEKPFKDSNDRTYYSMMPSEERYFTIRQLGNYNAEIGLFKQNGNYVEKLKTIELYTPDCYSINNNYFSYVDNLDKNYYRNQGYSVPCLLIKNNNKNYIITDTGTVGFLNLDTSIYYSTSYFQFATYNGKLVIVRCTNRSSYITSTDENGNSIYCQALNYVTVKPDGTVELGEDIILPTPTTAVPNEGQNGYYYSYTSFKQCTDINAVQKIRTEQYFKRKKTNVFPDGRVASGSWRSNGANYEFWYYIYLPDGRLCATGPTGFYADSDAYNYDPFIIVENDSKFVVGNTKPIDDHIREFYRVASIQNTDTGEATLVGATVGRKNISSEIATDTEPVQSIIDFSKDDLPIGFNVRDNVIDADNFTVETREQFNSIRLSDIVILKNGKQQSGTQNTGITLDEFNIASSDFGNANIRFYTNGQNFGWTASDTTNLNAGIYNKYFVIGDKTVYVTVKIVDVPDNSGTTTVVF
ncbi:MAG: hypothetical protein K5768_00825 [Firmicutes bacterium]|nr:hypothetical protein [Bacillota bacterium]